MKFLSPGLFTILSVAFFLCQAMEKVEIKVEEETQVDEDFVLPANEIDFTTVADEPTVYETNNNAVKKVGNKKRKTEVRSPLCVNINVGHSENIAKLLAVPGEVGKRDSRGILPLFRAIEKNSAYVKQILEVMEKEDKEKAQADCLLDVECKKKAFLLGCAKGHVDIMRIFLEKYPEVMRDAPNVRPEYFYKFGCRFRQGKNLTAVDAALLSENANALDLLIEKKLHAISQAIFDQSLSDKHTALLEGILKNKECQTMITDDFLFYGCCKGSSIVAQFCIEKRRLFNSIYTSNAIKKNPELRAKIDQMATQNAK